MSKVTFLNDTCKGCSLCVRVCPKRIISLSKEINTKGYNYAEVKDMDKCSGCASCAKMCPDYVITVER